jgi:hypothetical protein
LERPEVKKDLAMIYVHNLDVVLNEVNGIVVTLLVFLKLLHGKGYVDALAFQLLVPKVGC